MQNIKTRAALPVNFESFQGLELMYVYSVVSFLSEYIF